MQHHHAHVASCLTEHGRPGPVLGLAFDGLGYGADGTLWGGELLVADLQGFERVGHLAAITMPGGAAAIREPWRMGVAWAHEAGVDDPFEDERRSAVLDLVERGHGPVTSSMGRLFDAVAGAARHATSRELRGTGRHRARGAGALGTPRRGTVVPGGGRAPGRRGRRHRSSPAGGARSSRDRARGTAPAVVAAGFHESIGRAAAEAAIGVAATQGLSTVALTGGVFQNVRLSEVVEEALASADLEVLVHRVVPPNDAGISLGQAAIAAAQREA